jgi:uncharacterized protein (DUF58 family)
MRETSDFNLRYIVYFAVALVVGLAVVLAGATWVFKTFIKRDVREEVVRSEVQPVQVGPREPRLQVNPQQENQAYLAEQRAVLSKYGWVDQDHSVARIPIDRAMDIVAQEGLK